MNSKKELDIQQKICQEQNAKLRIRSKEERLKHALGMMEAKKIFENLNIPFYMGGGTLLGAYRENDFIPWDWDIEFDFKYEEVKKKREDIKSAFKKAGFKLKGERTKKKNWKLTFEKYGTSYELMGWYKKGGLRRRRHNKIKDKFFREYTFIEFYGEKFPCLAPIEEFLTYHYGDWHEPKRTSVKDEYLSPEFFVQKESTFNKLKNILKVSKNNRKSSG